MNNNLYFIEDQGLCMKKYNEVAILLINELKKYDNAEEMNRFLNEYKKFEPKWDDIENYLMKYYSYYFYCTISNGIVGVIFERIKGNFTKSIKQEF